MRLLLDTHVLLWWLDDPQLLSEAARKAIENPANTVYVSAATGWEIAIKKSLGKLTAPDNLQEVILDNRFIPLEVTMTHALGVLNLPDHHRDPFDRMLVVQAMQEGLTLVSRDSVIKAYGVGVVEG